MVAQGQAVRARAPVVEMDDPRVAPMPGPRGGCWPRGVWGQYNGSELSVAGYDVSWESLMNPIMAAGAAGRSVWTSAGIGGSASGIRWLWAMGYGSGRRGRGAARRRRA